MNANIPLDPQQRAAAIMDDKITIPDHNERLRLTAEIVLAIQDAFESGYKAAGGAICPDNPPGWGLVELSLDRDEINALADVADDFVDPRSRWHSVDLAPALQRFLDKISIFRRK